MHSSRCIVTDRPTRSLPAGWDPASWLGGGTPKPWSFHLGAKLILPLHYLDACGYSNDTLVLFADHDVIFQAPPSLCTASVTLKPPH